MQNTLNDRVVSPATTTASKKRSTAKRSPATPSKGERERTSAAKLAVYWAHMYTALAVVLSAGLNAFSAFAETTQVTLAGKLAAALVGGLIPCMVWILSKVTAHTHKAGWKRLALVSAGVASALLALSVIHVAAALAALTGSALLLSALFAVGIDCGLVASEATAVLVSSVE